MKRETFWSCHAAPTVTEALEVATREAVSAMRESLGNGRTALQRLAHHHGRLRRKAPGARCSQGPGRCTTYVPIRC